jgi:hypothetical protein
VSTCFSGTYIYMACYIMAKSIKRLLRARPTQGVAKKRLDDRGGV